MMAGFFSKKLSAELMAFYAKDFKLTDDLVFERACEEVCRQERTFPTPHVLRNYVVEQMRRRDKEHRDPGAMARVTDFTPSDPKAVAASRSLFRQAYEGKLRGHQLVAAMRKSEAACPGIGWGREADVLEKFLLAIVDRRRAA